MREPPDDFDASALLEVVRRQWLPEADSVAHLAVGFGAHHWVATTATTPTLFVTLDSLEGERHDSASLEDAYSATADLAGQGLEFVLAPLPARGGCFTIGFDGGAVSATPWVDGSSGNGALADSAEARSCAELLARLHGATAPARTPTWRPLVGPDFAERLARRLKHPWTQGPYGDQARRALLDRLPAIHRWTARYDVLARQALEHRASWCPTHGEPHTRNHLVTADRRYLVDWESLKVAPRERDLRTLVDDGHAAALAGDVPSEEMLDMFDLEWRLDEVAQYSDWFAGDHTGNPDDETALGGLLHELRRPERNDVTRDTARRRAEQV